MTAEGWWLYVIRCNKRLLYTGITTDVERRFIDHCEGRGARFTRGRRHLELVFSIELGEHSLALRAEHRFKALSAARKKRLIASSPSAAGLLETLGLR